MAKEKEKETKKKPAAKKKSPAKAKTKKPAAKKKSPAKAKTKKPAPKKEIAPVIPPEPWERQEDETERAFEAFALYRDLGSGNRSCAKVAAELRKSVGLIERWSRNHQWQKRIAAWDAEQDRIARQAQIDEIKKMRKRHADLATAMLVKAAKALKRIPEDEVKASDVSRLVETASKLERISRGDAGEIIEERAGGDAPSIVQFYMPDNHRDDEEPKEE